MSSQIPLNEYFKLKMVFNPQKSTANIACAAFSNAKYSVNDTPANTLTVHFGIDYAIYAIEKISNPSTGIWPGLKLWCIYKVHLDNSTTAILTTGDRDPVPRNINEFRQLVATKEEAARKVTPNPSAGRVNRRPSQHDSRNEAARPPVKGSGFGGF